MCVCVCVCATASCNEAPDVRPPNVKVFFALICPALHLLLLSCEISVFQVVVIHVYSTERGRVCYVIQPVSVWHRERKRGLTATACVR